jgi:large subunit ribosomal protein L22
MNSNMGARKRNIAEKRNQKRKTTYSAVLRNCPSSPRKMRLLADLIRGEDVNKALDMLRFNPKHASKDMEKLVMSAISNWQVKNENVRLEESKLFIKNIFVDQARTLKRIRPAPQGRAYRIRKRSNHVTVILGNQNEQEDTVISAETKTN